MNRNKWVKLFYGVGAVLIFLLLLPILGIWGENDTWVPVDQLDQLEIIWPHMDRLVIKDSGHCPMGTHLDAVDYALRYWLGEHPIAFKNARLK